MMENDWADKIAQRLVSKAKKTTLWADEVARELRKAKAGGLKECVDWLKNDIRGMKAQALRIEYGESE